MVRIDKNVTMPVIKNKIKKDKYPFSELKIGESFYTKDLKSESTVYTYCITNGNKYNAKFIYKKVNSGYRIWRHS